MRPKRLSKNKKEKKLQDGWIQFLEARHWFVEVMHASANLSGFPDLFACHEEHGIRLIEIKLPNMVGSRFTDAQMEKFPKFEKHGAPVYILTEVCHSEYEKLFLPQGNFHTYLMLKEWRR